MTSKQLALRSFQEYLSRQIEADLSPEEVVARWREEQATVAAVREALADVSSGRTQTLEEFDAEFRRRHGLGAAS